MHCIFTTIVGRDSIELACHPCSLHVGIDHLDDLFRVSYLLQTRHARCLLSSISLHAIAAGVIRIVDHCILGEVRYRLRVALTLHATLVGSPLFDG